MSPLLHSIRLQNFLSFGDSVKEIALKPLNVVIGPNGSGKSNLIEAIELIRATPKDLLGPIRDGGGVRDWLWKGAADTPTATIDATIEYPKGPTLRYLMSFTRIGQQFEIVDERIENEKPDQGYDQPYFYYQFQNGDLCALPRNQHLASSHPRI